MSGSFDFERLDGFVAGAVGPPGARTFYLQARVGNDVVAFKMEKEQVAMLGHYLGQVVTTLGGAEPDRDVTGLVEPVEARWVVGTLSAGVDEETRTVHITAEELQVDEVGEGFTEEFDLDDEFEDDLEDDLDDDLDDTVLDDAIAETLEELLGIEDGRTARFVLTLAQAAAFAEVAAELVAAGRPPCRLCGRAMEPGGHDCPRWN